MDSSAWLIFWLFTVITAIWDGVKSRNARNGKGEGISEKGYFFRVRYRAAVFVIIATAQYYIEPFPEEWLILKLILLQMAIFWIVFELIVHNAMFLPSLRGFIHIGSSAPLDKLTRALGMAIGTALFGKGREYLLISNIIAYGAKFTALYASIHIFYKTITWTFY